MASNSSSRAIQRSIASISVLESSATSATGLSAARATSGARRGTSCDGGGSTARNSGLGEGAWLALLGAPGMTVSNSVIDSSTAANAAEIAESRTARDGGAPPLFRPFPPVPESENAFLNVAKRRPSVCLRV